MGRGSEANVVGYKPLEQDVRVLCRELAAKWLAEDAAIDGPAK